MIPTLHWHSGTLERAGVSVHLTPQQAQCLAALGRGRMVDGSFGHLIEALWPDPDEEPDEAMNTIRVTLHHLKKKVSLVGLKIDRRWGWGKQLVGAFHIDWRRCVGLRPRVLFRLPSRPYGHDRPFIQRIVSCGDDEIAAAYRSGLTIIECAWQFQIGEWRIIRALDRAGVKRRAVHTRPLEMKRAATAAGLSTAAIIR